MTKTLAELTAEIRAINIEKGWRAADGGPGTNTWGDYIALLHSEVSETLEAFRDHKFADATPLSVCVDPRCNRFHFSNPRPGDIDFDIVEPCPAGHLRDRKPEGVGSELADCVIRLLDMCDVFGIKPWHEDSTLGGISWLLDQSSDAETFGDWIAWLHFRIVGMRQMRALGARDMLRAIVTVARYAGVDLDAEVTRKIAYNRTRSFQHGGRTL